jgi:hypothetical protein
MPQFNIKKKKEVSCKQCGELNLHWEQDPRGRWQLFGPEGVPHKCLKKGNFLNKFLNWKRKP